MKQSSMVHGASPEAVLVVDADQDYVKAIRAALADEVDHIEAVASISSAVNQLQGRGHRMVIMDCRLAGDPTAMDLARALRRTRPEVAVVMTSSVHLTSTEKAACFEAGADEFIEKPFHPQEFAARVRAVSRRVRRSMAPSAPSVSEDVDADQALRAIA
jgi:DNA-binding response OmpR family regulator